MFDLSAQIAAYKEAFAKLLEEKKKIQEGFDKMPSLFASVLQGLPQETHPRKFLPSQPECPYIAALNRAYLFSLLSAVERETGIFPNLKLEVHLFEDFRSERWLYSKKDSCLETESFSLSDLVEKDFSAKYGRTPEDQFLRWLVDQAKQDSFLQFAERASDRKLTFGYIHRGDSQIYGADLWNLEKALRFVNACIEFALGGSIKNLHMEQKALRSDAFKGQGWAKLEYGQEYPICENLAHIKDGTVRIFKNRSASLMLRKEEVSLFMLAFEKIKVFF